MTPSALPNLVPSVGKSSTPVPSTSVAPGATSADADLFSTQLATSIAQATAKKAATAPAASATTAPSAPVDSSTALTALQTQIAAQLNAGQSLSSVTAQLASALATKVAAKLGVSTEDARKKLEAAFTAALSPPGSTAGTGPPLTTAQQALALAQTFLQTASVATGVATGESGQLNRFLGTDLDADQAKANPAPTTTTTPVTPLATAQVVPGSAAASADIAALAKLTGAPIASESPQGDGRSVALPQGVAVASTGGTTLLGRILARASLAASAAPSISAPSPAASPTSAAAASTASVNSAAQDVVDALLGESSAGQSFGAAASRATSASASAATAAASPPAPTVTAFLQAFTSALSSSASAAATTATLDAHGKSATPEASLLVAGSSSTESASSIVPSVPGFSIDQASSSSSTTAAQNATSQTAVDNSAIVEQVLRGAFLQTNGTSSTIRLSLVPEHLGDVSVKLNVDTSGNVSAHVTAQTAEAGQALTQGQSQLTRSLADAGLKLTSYSVDVSNSGLGGNANGQQQSSQQQSSGRHATIAGLAADAPSGDESDLLAVPTFGPPIVATRTLGAYNYLA
jgi:flagellar hook-length control protein FliK